MRKFAIGLAVLFLVPLLLASAVLAKVVSGDAAGVATGQVVDDDLYIAGKDVAIEGTVNGDVYVAANSVSVSGTVNGDVIAAAQTVSVSGTIRDDLRAVAQTIQLTGAKIGDSVSVASQSFTADRSRIGGGLSVAAGNATVRSPIGRGIVGSVSSLVVSSSVGKDIRVSLDQLILNQGARVGGEVVYKSNNEAQVAEGVKIAGGLRRTAHDTDREAGSPVMFVIWSLLSSLIVGMLLLRFFPASFEQTRKFITSRPWAMAGWGLVLLLAAVPVAVLLMITVLGIPLALILLTLFALVVYTAKFFAVYAIAQLIAQRYKIKKPNAYLLLAIGLAIYYLLLIIPILGWILRLAIFLVGTGALTVYLTQKLKTRPVRRT